MENKIRQKQEWKILQAVNAKYVWPSEPGKIGSVCLKYPEFYSSFFSLVKVWAYLHSLLCSSRLAGLEVKVMAAHHHSPSSVPGIDMLDDLWS